MPIVVYHNDRRAEAQAAMGAGNYRAQQGNYQNSIQNQRLGLEQQRYDQLSIDAEERRRQQDFQNQLQQQNLQRQWQRDDATANYNQQRIGLGEQGLDYRRQALAQRLDELGQKISAGAATREDVQEHQSLMREQQAQDAMSRTQFSQGAQDTRQKAGFDFTSGQHEMDRDLRRTLDESHNRRVEAALQATMGRANSSLQMQQLSKGLASIYSQRRSIDAQADTAWTPQAKRELDYKREQLKQKEQEILSAINQIQPITPQAPAAPSAPTFQPEGVPEQQGMPPMSQGSESGYSVGQLIPTPKGQVRIVGFDQDGMPLVEPA